jgi:hypothetical protein
MKTANQDKLAPVGESVRDAVDFIQLEAYNVCALADLMTEISQAEGTSLLTRRFSRKWRSSAESSRTKSTRSNGPRQD